MEPILSGLFLGHPLWMWLGFLALVTALLAFDLGFLNGGGGEIGARKSLLLSGFYIVLGLGFGGLVAMQLGREAGIEYVTGLVLEKSLALDNLFVIATIFGYLSIPRKYQHRVLFWGILGVIFLRAIMIGLGTALVSSFGWVLYVFAAFLIFTGFRMLRPDADPTGHADSRVMRFIQGRLRVTQGLRENRFFVRERDPRTGRLAVFVTPLFLALVVIEIADIVFAVDSVPAIFAITLDPYIVYTSNIFCNFGLASALFRACGGHLPVCPFAAGACRLADVCRLEDLCRRSSGVGKIPGRVVPRSHLRNPGLRCLHFNLAHPGAASRRRSNDSGAGCLTGCRWISSVKICQRLIAPCHLPVAGNWLSLADDTTQKGGGILVASLSGRLHFMARPMI